MKNSSLGKFSIRILLSVFLNITQTFQNHSNWSFLSVRIALGHPFAQFSTPNNSFFASHYSISMAGLLESHCLPHHPPRTLKDINQDFLPLVLERIKSPILNSIQRAINSPVFVCVMLWTIISERTSWIQPPSLHKNIIEDCRWLNCSVLLFSTLVLLVLSSFIICCSQLQSSSSSLAPLVKSMASLALSAAGVVFNRVTHPSVSHYSFLSSSSSSSSSLRWVSSIVNTRFPAILKPPHQIDSINQ